MRLHHFLPSRSSSQPCRLQSFVEEGIDLPGAPDASFDWEYLYVDTAATPYADSNRVVFTSMAESGFLHFWDFGNGLTSNETDGHRVLPSERRLQCDLLRLQRGWFWSGICCGAHCQYGRACPAKAPWPCSTGCDNQKTWILSGEAGAMWPWAHNPAAPSGTAALLAGLVPEQYDDSYQFTVNGEYFYDNNGGTVNPYEGYVVSELPVPDTLNYLLTDASRIEW